MKSKITKMIPIILAIAAVIGAVFQYYESLENERKADLNQAKAEEAANKLIEAQKTLIETQNKTYFKTLELAEANRQNLELSRELNKLQDHTLKIALGEGNLEVELLPNFSNGFQFVIANQTKYPSYDIYVGAYDFNEIFKCKTITINNQFFIDKKCFNSNLVGQIWIQTLASGTTTTMNNVIQLKPGYNHFMLQVHTRIGVSVYKFVVENLGNANLRGAWILEKVEDDKVIEVKRGGSLNINDEYWEKYFYGKSLYKTYEIQQ